MDSASIPAKSGAVVAPSLLTAEEVAQRWQVPKSWVYRAARQRRIPSVPCGRYRRFDPHDLERWVAQQKVRRAEG